MLEDMELSLLTERRRHAPPGADGGEPGAKGRNLLDGEELPPKARRTLRAGRAPAHRDARRRRARPPYVRRMASRPAAAAAGVVHQDIRVDGCRWHVATAGDPEAPPLVLLHGWPQHWWVWRRVIPALAQRPPRLRARPARLRLERRAARPLREGGPRRRRRDAARRAGDRPLRRSPATTGAASSPGWWPCRRRERVERLVALSIIHPWFVPERNLKALTSTLYQLPIVTPGVNRVLPPLGLRADAPDRRAGLVGRGRPPVRQPVPPPRARATPPSTSTAPS